MTKSEFQELLRRYRAGDCSVEEIQTINAWFAKISDENLELTDLEKVEVNERMLRTIHTHIPNETTNGKIRPIGFTLLKVAASLVLLLVVGYLVFNETVVAPSNEIAHDQSPAGLVAHKNVSQNIMKIQLPDLSTVELKPNAEISYAQVWNEDKREVHLVGEAFFEVVKDSKRPFYVYGGDIVTKVLGTSFSVRAAMNAESIEVAVHTGKVSVYEDASKHDSNQNGNDVSGVVLTPNERVEYFVSNKHWVTSLVSVPKPLPASNKAVEFVFSNTAMSEIIKSIERTYSIDIVTENESPYSCTFTGDVSMMELYDLLDVICKSTGTNYEVKGTKILITGKGCE